MKREVTVARGKRYSYRHGVCLLAALALAATACGTTLSGQQQAGTNGSVGPAGGGLSAAGPGSTVGNGGSTLGTGGPGLGSGGSTPDNGGSGLGNGGPGSTLGTGGPGLGSGGSTPGNGGSGLGNGGPGSTLGTGGPGLSSGGSTPGNGGSGPGNGPSGGRGVGTPSPRGSGATGSGSPTVGAVPGAATTPRSTFPVANGTPGVSPSDVLIGADYDANGQAVQQAAGVNINTGSYLQYLNIMKNWINSTGGLGHRKIQLITHAYDDTSSETVPQLEQEACSDFTQDHHVYVVLSQVAVNTGFHTDNYWSCLAHGGTSVLIGAADSIEDDAFFAGFPLDVQAAGLSLNSVAATTVAGLNSTNYFRGAKVAVLTVDSPEFHRAVNNTLLPSLHQIGADVKDVVYVPAPQNEAGLGATSSQLQSTVLRFRTEGIDHVLIFEVSGGLSFLFMTQAESQQYRPRYGMNSQNEPEVLAGQAPAAQQSGAVFAGWAPFQDIGEDYPPWTPTQNECIGIFRAQGVIITHSLASGSALYTCDEFLYLRATVNAAGYFGVGAISKGLAALGSSTSSAVTGSGTLFSSRRHYGVAQYRLGIFDSACTCYKYTSGLLAVPR